MNVFKSVFLIALSLAILGTHPAARAQEQVPFTQAQLDQMMAPIALYPDTVLSHVLIAATYPLEVVEAARWSRAYPELRGEEAVARVEGRNWDASVKALVAFPELIQRMDEDLRWTQNLGDAFLTQEGDVVDTVQYLRNQAYEEGNLASTDQVEVIRETKYIYIEPARPTRVYVPYYDPRVVYGSWRWASYPPVYWHHPPGFSIGVNFYWGSGFSISPSFYFSAFHWSNRNVVVINNNYYNGYFRHPHRAFRYPPRHAHGHGPSRWRHNPHHRRGVTYRHHVEPERFSQPVAAHRAPRSANRHPQGPNPRQQERQRTAPNFTGRSQLPAEAGLRDRSNQRVRTPAERASASKKTLTQRTTPVRRSGPSPVGTNSPKIVRESRSGANHSGAVRSGTRPKARNLEQRTQPARRSQPAPIKVKPSMRVSQTQPGTPGRSTRSQNPVRSTRPVARNLEQRTQPARRSQSSPVKTKPVTRSAQSRPSAPVSRTIRQPTPKQAQKRTVRPQPQRQNRTAPTQRRAVTPSRQSVGKAKNHRAASGK